MPPASSEQVLVVPTALFQRLGHFQGFCASSDRYLDILLADDHVRYRPRAEVEEDPAYKQLIPYVIFQHPAADGLWLFQYTRGGGQDEARLRQRRSIGIGGHIALGDGARHAAYADGLQRELAEEVIIETPYRAQCVGLINDDENPVGRVHLGVVHLFTVERPAVRPREDEMLHSGFQPLAALHAELDHFETWSQICLRALLPAPC